MKVFKDFIKPFGAPQRSVKIKVNFLSSSGSVTRMVKECLNIVVTRLENKITCVISITCDGVPITGKKTYVVWIQISVSVKTLR